MQARIPLLCMCAFSIIYGCMSWLFLMFLGYGQLLVLGESLSVQLVSSWYQWICTVCIVLSENKYDKPKTNVASFRLDWPELRAGPARTYWPKRGPITQLSANKPSDFYNIDTICQLNSRHFLFAYLLTY